MAKSAPRFASASYRLDHFHRHGAGVHAISPRQYEIAAARFFSGPPVAGVHEKTRSNGDVIRYNEHTEEFGVLRPNGGIRTFFRPDPAEHGYRSNLEYFNAQ